MTEYYVELQDSNGTYYGTTWPRSDEPMYFEDLNEARIYAKYKLSDEYPVTRIVEVGKGLVVDFFQLS